MYFSLSIEGKKVLFSNMDMKVEKHVELLRDKNYDTPGSRYMQVSTLHWENAHSRNLF